MLLSETSCSRCVGGHIACCGKMIKYGKTKSGNQRYVCGICHKSRVGNYIYKAYLPGINNSIIQLTKEGLGIRSTARVLGISMTTLLRRIVSIAKSINRPIISKGRIYEVDEMRTFIRSKDRLVWIAFALDRATREVACFSVGKRTNKTLYPVIKNPGIV